MKLFVFLQVTLITSFYTNTFLVSAAEDVDTPIEVERKVNIENDNILRDYLGYYGNFIPEQMENWCPTNCNNGSQIFVNPHFSAYCSCIEKEDSWHLEKHYCADNEIFNETTSGCLEIPGKGYPTCVMKGHKCPNNDIGIRKHPDNELFKNYLICSRDLVIVGECAEMHHFDDLKKSCAILTITSTDLVASDCPIVKKIECEKPGIFPVISKGKFSRVCKNCFYICGIKNEKVFELKISCETKPVGQIGSSYQADYSNASETIGKDVTKKIRNEQASYPAEKFSGNSYHIETFEAIPHQTESTFMLELGETQTSETPADYSVDESEPPEGGQSNKTTHNGATIIKYQDDSGTFESRHAGEPSFSIESLRKHPANDPKLPGSSQSGEAIHNNETRTKDNDTFESRQSAHNGNGGTPTKQLKWYFWLICWCIINNVSRW